MNFPEGIVPKCMFIDGPIVLYLCAGEEPLEALERVKMLVEIYVRNKIDSHVQIPKE